MSEGRIPVYGLQIPGQKGDGWIETSDIERVVLEVLHKLFAGGRHSNIVVAIKQEPQNHTSPEAIQAVRQRQFCAIWEQIHGRKSHDPDLDEPARGLDDE